MVGEIHVNKLELERRDRYIVYTGSQLGELFSRDGLYKSNTFFSWNSFNYVQYYKSLPKSSVQCTCTLDFRRKFDYETVCLNNVPIFYALP